VLLVLEGWLLDEVSVAMLDDPLEAGEATVIDVVRDAVLVADVVVVSDIVKTDVAVHIGQSLAVASGMPSMLPVVYATILRYMLDANQYSAQTILVTGF
jgi:hypothetical protein